MNRSSEEKKKAGYLRWAKSKVSYAKRHLKVGSIVTTCKGYNSKVKEIHLDRKELIDIDLIFENGMSCSLIHCCEFPPQSVDQILEYFRKWGTEGKEYLHEMSEDGQKLTAEIMSGENPFDERGCLHAEISRTLVLV